jgi:hypothetical protein
MKVFSVTVSIMVVIQSLTAQTAGDYRSAGTGTWATASTWQTYNGTSWVPAVAGPTSADGAITILSGHTVTIAVNVTADQLTVNAGGQLAITAALTIANGTGTDLQVNGILDKDNGNLNIPAGADAQVSGLMIVEGTSGSMNLSGTMNFAAGSTYRHARNDGNLPAAAQTTWALTSSCEITGVIGTKPGNLDQAFGNLTWNCPSQTGSENLTTSFTTVNGNFVMQSTGAGEIQFAQTGNSTMAIGGNYVQTGGNVVFTTVGNRTVNVGGNFSLSGGSLDMATGAGTSILSIAGNFLHTGGALTRSSGTAGGSATVVFNGSGTQTYTSGGSVSGIVNYTVNSGAVLFTGSSTLGSGSSGTFTLSTGGTLGIGSAAGITTSGASGNIQVGGSRSYSTGANYTYNGTAAQTTGNGLPATLNNLTIDNTSGVTLGSSTTVGGMLTLTNGLLVLGNNTLTLGSGAAIGGSFTNANMIVADLAAGTGEVRKIFTDGIGVSRSFTFPIGDNSGTADYAPVTLDYTTGNFSSASVGLSVKNVKHPNNMATNDYIDRFWRITSTGISNFSCTGSFTYVSGDRHGEESNIVPGLWDGAGWTRLNTANATPPTLTGTMTSFAPTSHVTGGEPGALPIELGPFTGSEVNNHTVRLVWNTVTEINNFGFEIQKSVAQYKNYETIGRSFVPGHGTTLTPQTYSFIDTAASIGTWYYRLKQTDLDGTVYFSDGIRIEVTLGGGISSHASNHALLQNYPNPFNPKTTIWYGIAEPREEGMGSHWVTLKVYDLLGREVATLVNERKGTGTYSVEFDASNLASGIYLYQLRTDRFTQTRTLMVLR